VQIEELKARVAEIGFAAIGQRIFRARTARELSIRELADRSEVSKTTIVRVERGDPIQLDTIRYIAKGLRMRLAELVAPNFTVGPPPAIHRRSQEMWFDIYAYQGMRTTPELPRNREEWPAEALPFCSIGARDYETGLFNPNLIYVNQPTQMRTHRGEEFAFVISGRLRIVFDQSSEELDSGESIYFFAGERHRYEPAGEEPAMILSIVLDPSPAGLVSLEAWDRDKRHTAKEIKSG
jgi:transcriptional regulator with XRE-family HTH domain